MGMMRISGMIGQVESRTHICHTVCHMICWSEAQGKALYAISWWRYCVDLVEVWYVTVDGVYPGVRYCVQYFGVGSS